MRWIYQHRIAGAISRNISESLESRKNPKNRDNILGNMSRVLSIGGEVTN